MNKTKKYLALISAAILSFAILPSCKEDEESSKDKTAEATYESESTTAESTTMTETETTTAATESAVSSDNSTNASQTTEPVNNNGGAIRTEFYGTDAIPAEYMDIYSKLITSLTTSDGKTVSEVLFEPYLITQNYSAKTYMNMDIVGMLNLGFKYIVNDTAYISSSTTNSFGVTEPSAVQQELNNILSEYLNTVSAASTSDTSAVDYTSDINTVSSYLNAEFTDCYTGSFSVVLNGVSNGKTAPLNINCVFGKYNGIPYIIYIEILQ